MSKAKGYFRSHCRFFFFHYYFMEMFVCVICGQETDKPHLPVILFFCLAYLKQTVNNVVVWLEIKVQ